VTLRFLIVVFLALLSGCWASAIGTLQISQPDLEDQGSRRDLSKGGVALVDGLSIAVVPINYRRIREFVGPLFLPIIPIGGDSSHRRQGLPFRIVIEVEVSTPGITFDPRIAELRIGTQVLRPAYASGPYGGIYGTRTAWYRALPGHTAWACNYQSDAPLGMETTSPTIIGDRTCFSLEFAVDTPTSSQEFSISIGGLARGGATVSVPTFHFKPSTATYVYRIADGSGTAIGKRYASIHAHSVRSNSS
jgi:hypothetical protein